MNWWIRLPLPCNNTYQCSCGATVCQHTQGHSRCGTQQDG